MAPERLWITVYVDDDEAAGYWREEGVPESRIMRYGVAEGNYWFSGDVGPCGPCSELHYDFGAQDGCPALRRWHLPPGDRVRALPRDMEPGVHGVLPA